MHHLPASIIVYFSLYLFLSYCLTYTMLTRHSERDRSKSAQKCGIFQTNELSITGLGGGGGGGGVSSRL